jgi:glutaredoxin
LRLTIYSKPGCRLCDEMKAVVHRVIPNVESVLEEVDISTDAELNARYGAEIPVLMIDGRKVAKYRVTEADLRKALAARLKERRLKTE